MGLFKNRFAPYVLSVLVVIGFHLIRVALGPVLGGGVPFMLFLLAVATVGWFAGFFPAVLATALGGLLAVLYFIPPQGVLQITEITDVAAVVLYLLSALTISYLSSDRTLARREAMERFQDLERTEEDYRVLVSGVRDYAIYMLSPDGRVQNWNEGAAQMKGYTEDEAIGKHYSFFFSPEEREIGKPEGQLERAREKGHFEEEVWRSRKDGSRFMADVAVSPLHNSDGSLRGYSVMIRDITRQHEAERLARENAEKQRTFMQEMLQSVTEGRLNLCFSRKELPNRLRPVGQPIELGARTLSTLRAQIHNAAIRNGFPDERWQDLVTAVGEAAMNAVVHAGGGTAYVYENPDSELQVWIEDHGTGISEESLHRVTLERGFTTAGSWGHGFWMMMKMADRIWLQTGRNGTTVVVQQGVRAPEPDWYAGYGALESSDSKQTLNGDYLPH